MSTARIYIERIFINNDGDPGVKGAGDFRFSMTVKHNGEHDSNRPFFVLNEELLHINTGHEWLANKFFDTDLVSPLEIAFTVQEEDDGADDWAQTSAITVSPYDSGEFSVKAKQSGGNMQVTIHFRVEFFPVSLDRVWPNTRVPLLYKCLGFVDGPKWLDGNTVNGEVRLVAQSDGAFTGTRWQLEHLNGGGLGLNCHGNIDGPRWLDGNTRTGAVYLSPNTAGHYTGTHWSRVKAPASPDLAGDSFYLKCLGSIPGLAYLDGNTVNGLVSLAPESAFENSQFSGAKWMAYW